MKTCKLEELPHTAPQAFFPSMIVVAGDDLLHFEAQVEELRHVQHVEGIVAVTKNRELFSFCSSHSIHAVFEAGDLLSCLYSVARGFDLEVLIRVQGVVSSALLDRALFYFRTHFDELDYAETADRAIEIMRFDVLEDAFYHSKERLYFEEYITHKFRSIQFVE